MHLILERRVPDKATRDAKATLEDIAPRSTFPTEVVQHCADQVRETYEWLPCRFVDWLTLDDVTFAKAASTFYEVWAVSLLSESTGRHIAPDESKPSLWPLLASGCWRSVAIHAGYDDDTIESNAMAYGMEAVGLPHLADEVFEDFRVRSFDYRRFALFSKDAGEIRVPSEGITPLSCMLVGEPCDMLRRNRPARHHDHTTRNAVHPSYQHVRSSGGSTCHCNLGELLSTDWDVVCDSLGRTRRTIISTETIDEFNRLGATISDAGLSTHDYRLLVWFE